jgi:translation initiation factor IF-2, N-terminal domain protein
MSTEVKQDNKQEVSQEEVQETGVMSEVKTESVVAESTLGVDIEAVKKTLEAREEELAKWQKELAEKASELKAESVRIHQKNMDLDEREKTIEEGLKLKINSEYAEAKSKLSEEQAKSRADFVAELDGKRDEFEKSRQKAIADLDKELEGARVEAKKELDALRKSQEAELKKAREDSEKELQKQREEQKAKLKEEKDLALQQLEIEKAERTAELKRRESALSNERARLQAENARVEGLEKELEKREEDLLDQQRILERDKRRLERERLRIEESDSDLDEVVNRKIEDTIKKLNQVIETKNKELDSLREQLAAAVGEIELVKSFREAYGEDPQVLIQSIKQLQDSNKQLRDKLSNSSDKADLDSLSVAYREAKAEKERLLEENRYLSDSQGRVASLEAQFRTLDSQHKSLLATCESLENQLEAKNQELVRLSTPEGRVADRDDRIAAIMTGAMDDKKDLAGAGDGFDSRYNKKDEIDWLEDVWKKCEEYGIKFNKRILYAFHTALKINEWSTITVLAGVSGTGKSELPRLYSEFGGLNFCSVAVQPNWDSQESMLGFFNSIDNQFEPEELLKFLVQCTTDPRYNEYMSVVLLDEMNLAHVEHYFAEFLSKLESRRGLSRKDLPEIEVKLGAGVKPYGLKLSRTLLWTGTMNQDETTKSLSDKVLDRGIVINFPRPKNLESRAKMGLITDYINDDRAKLHKDTWQSWTSHTIEFSEEQKKEVENYRIIVQKINNALEEVGRALGHRVWQSIEYYIANYPTVRQAMKYQPKQNEKGKIVCIPTNSELTGELKEAMRTAFEDQIVQKIMPKLRGIETRDKRGKSSLDKIEDLLVTHDFASLQEDFQIAREQGYGQFIWNSAKYLDEKEENESQE